MRKLIFAFTAILGMTVEAQNITDAVRYSSTDLNGTARYRAMSGAFGALGGDLSSLNVNPAGSAVFLNSSATFTLNYENTENEVTFMNEFNSNSHDNFDLGQGGAVFVFDNNDENANWKKFALAFNYNKTANFEDDYTASGQNSTSISEYFLSYAQGIALDYLVPRPGETNGELYSYLGETRGLGFGAQQAFLGVMGGVIDVNNPDNLPKTEESGYYDLNTYSSILSPGPYDQSYFYSATGLNGKFSFNFATQYQDFLYLGINLNTHFLNYERVTALDEVNFIPTNEGEYEEFVYFENRLSTLGSGFSFQLGALAKAGENLRIGAAFESPTWYTISEETTQFIESDIAVVDPGVVNIYPEYKLQTPMQYTGSLAYLFGTSALLSFDYSYNDYSSTQFKPKDDPAFVTQNDIISNELKGASVYRLGGEYRIQGWSLRGGYRFEESPYRDETTVGDLTGYSAGLGYNFGNIKVDLAYSAYERDLNPQLYQTGLTNRMNIAKSNTDFILSLSFGL